MTKIYNYSIILHGDGMINIINACTDLGVNIDGTNLGPEVLTNNLSIKKDTINKENIVKSKDKLDLKKNLSEVNKFTSQVFNKTLEILNNGDFPLLIGGDHSSAIGSALASESYYNNIGIIWIDAHGDYNTFETTHTGNLHGLPLAAITGYKCDLLTNFITQHYINPKNCVIVGARSIDPWEIGNLRDAGVTIFTTEDIHNKGTKQIMDEAFKVALNNTIGTHISYDIDVIDPIIAPGVSVPEINGINEIEAYEIMDYLISKKENIKSMDIVEFNPTRDIDDKTKIIAENLINKFIK